MDAVKKDNKEVNKRFPVPADKTQDCPPHWYINGVCKKCGAVDNSSRYYIYGPETFQAEVKYGILAKGQSYYKPVEIFRV